MKHTSYTSDFNLFMSISFLALSSSHVHAQGQHNISNLDQEREKIIISIKQGSPVQGLAQLKKLLYTFPNNQKLLADYLVLSLQHHQFSEYDQQLLRRIEGSSFPVYAQIPLVKALRDLKQFATALDVLEKFNPNSSQVDLKHIDIEILRAVLLAENGQKQRAIIQLQRLNQIALTTDKHKSKLINTDQAIQMAYANRIIGQPIYALSIIQNTLKNTPQAPALHREYLNVLLALGSHQQVLGLIQEQPALDPEHSFIEQALLGQFSEDIKDAIKNQKYLSRQGETDAESFKKLDQVLNDAEKLKAKFRQTSPLAQRLLYEYLYALSYRGRHVDVLTVKAQLGKPVNDMPAYVRHSIADAYLATRQPEQAESVYLSLLSEKNYADMTVYTSLYYALIEQEKYTKANRLIRDVDKRIPTFQYSLAKGVDKRVHPDRADYMGLKENAYAYSNQLERAEQNLNKITAQTPNNEDYLNSLSRIQRWREKPQLAQQTLARLNGLEPQSKSTRINQMQNTQALGNVGAWRDQVQLLNKFYPKDTSVIKSAKELEDRDHFSISHASRFSKSKADQDQVLETLKGSQDFESTTRINSPWFAENYRVFTEYQHRMGDYRDGKIQEKRGGLGAEWASQQKSLTAILSQDLDGDRAGLALDWNHRLSDHWRYNLNFDSQADVPLQALIMDKDAQSYGIGLGWQANESKQATLQYQATDISDGNLRQELSAAYQQNIWTQAHHTTRAGVSAYLGKNSSDQTSYFSPKESLSAAVDLSHDWLTWRNYEQSLTQQFSLTAGVYKQNRFDTEAVLDARYAHKWQISRTWGLNYGIGWGMHPYDGIKEKQWYGNLGFEGRF